MVALLDLISLFFLQTHDLTEEDKRCAFCGLPHLPPALDECNEFIEAEVRAYTCRVRRPAYLRTPGCSCERGKI